jgi:hypothetical protein
MRLYPPANRPAAQYAGAFVRPDTGVEVHPNDVDALTAEGWTSEPQTAGVTAPTHEEE